MYLYFTFRSYSELRGFQILFLSFKVLVAETSWTKLKNFQATRVKRTAYYWDRKKIWLLFWTLMAAKWTTHHTKFRCRTAMPKNSWSDVSSLLYQQNVCFYSNTEKKRKKRKRKLVLRSVWKISLLKMTRCEYPWKKKWLWKMDEVCFNYFWS